MRGRRLKEEIRLSLCLNSSDRYLVWESQGPISLILGISIEARTVTFGMIKIVVRHNLTKSYGSPHKFGNMSSKDKRFEALSPTFSVRHSQVF